MEIMEIIKMVAIAVWALIGVISLIASVAYFIIFMPVIKPTIKMYRDMFKEEKEEATELKRVK